VVQAVRGTALAGAAELLRALASEVRLAVVVELANAPRCVHQLQAALRGQDRDVSQPLLSQHLKVLRDARLVTTTRAGTEINYQLVNDRIVRIVVDVMRQAAREEEPWPTELKDLLPGLPAND
jgi:DNA-binding transcriptional ArsR family regulator